MTNVRRKILTYILSGIMAGSLAAAGVTAASAVSSPVSVVAETEHTDLSSAVDGKYTDGKGTVWTVVSDYEGLVAALNSSAENSDKIILGADVTVTATVLVNGGTSEGDIKTITLNGNGYALTSSADLSAWMFMIGTETTDTSSALRPVNLVFENVTIEGKGADVSDSLRALRLADNSALTFGNGVVFQNFNSSANGVIFCRGSFVMKTGSSVINCTDSSTESNKGSVIALPSQYSVFTLDGGTISNCTATNGIINLEVSKATFTMKDGTISQCTAKNGGAVYSKGVFTMTGGTISNCSNSVTSGCGGGVYVAAGTFRMSAGTIDTCETNTTSNAGGDARGGGVYVAGGAFEMSGSAVVSGNSARVGGGVAVAAGGTFAFDGGMIQGNKSLRPNTNGGAGVYNAGTFTMTDGTITANTASYHGGGVCNEGGVFTMNGGTIDGNTAAQYGGGVYNSGTFTVNGGGTLSNSTAKAGGGVYTVSELTMTDGLITGNKATTSGSTGGGGGVCVYAPGTFLMTGGTVSKNNTAQYGGGVAVYGTKTSGGETAAFTMTGGTIAENTNTRNGTARGIGVYVEAKATFALSGGSITGNEADRGSSGSDNCGAGIQLRKETVNPTLILSGNPTVTGNTLLSKTDSTNGIESNLFREFQAQVSVGEYFVGKIGVLTVNSSNTAVAPTAGSVFANCAENAVGLYNITNDYGETKYHGTFSNSGSAVRWVTYTEVPVPSLQYRIGAEVSARGDITLRSYFDISDSSLVGDYLLAVITLDGKIYKTEYVTEQNFSDGYYIVESSLPAAYMTSSVSMQLFNKSGSGQKVTTSVKKMSDYMIANGATRSDLLKAMLDYGAAAQTYFGINEDTLANETNSGAVQTPSVGDGNTVTGGVISGYEVSCDSTLTIRLYAKENFTVTINGKEVETFALNGKYYADIENIYAVDILRQFVVVVNGSETYKVSVAGCCYSMVQNGTQAQKALASALYTYGVVSYKTFGASYETPFLAQ